VYLLSCVGTEMAVGGAPPLCATQSLQKLGTLMADQQLKPAPLVWLVDCNGPPSDAKLADFAKWGDGLGVGKVHHNAADPPSRRVCLSVCLSVCPSVSVCHLLLGVLRPCAAHRARKGYSVRRASCVFKRRTPKK
jgi:hypothetical protein